MKGSKFALLMILVLIVSMLPVVTARGQDKFNLQLTWWGSKDRHDRTTKVLDMYKAANPNIDVTFEFSSWADYWTKLNTQAAGGKLACVMQQDYAYIGEWSSRGLLIPLDDYVKSGVINTKDVSDASLAGGKINGKLVGINLGNNSQSFVLDTDMFKKAGVDLPSAQWTWKEFEDVSLKLHKALGVWAFGSDLISETLWKSIYLGNKMQFIADDGTALAYKDDKPLIDHFNMILRLMDAGAIPPADQTAEWYNVGPEKVPFVTKKAAIDYRWSNQIVALVAAAGKDRQVKLWPLPRPEGGQSENFIKPSMFFSITSQCKNPDEAAKFINYFINNKEANDVLFAERGVPVSSAIREYLTPKLQPAQAAMFDFVAAMEKDSSPIQPAEPPGWNDVVNNVYLPEIANPILFKTLKVEDGVVLLRQKADAIFAKNKK